MTKRTCSHGSKVGYSNEDQAKEARKTLKWRTGKMGNTKIYKCPYCKRFHLTSKGY